MSELGVPQPWRFVVFSTALTEYPIKLTSVERPAALGTSPNSVIGLLDKLQPPEQEGAHVWGARICYWTAEQVQQLHKFEVPPTLVYKYGGMPGSVDPQTWHGLMSMLQQPQRKEQTEQPSAAAEETAAPASPQGNGRFCNVLLLHVAGRYNDFSIKLLLVPRANQEAATSGKSSDRVMLWAYFMVLPTFSVEQRIQMEVQHQMAPLTLDAVMRALKQRRSHDKLWQSCIEYQLRNQPQENGLPAWMKNITLKAHLSQAAPRGQLDLVDRCHIAKRDDDRATAAVPSACNSAADDACASGYAAAGADSLELSPLRLGPAEQFEEPCSCPAGLWCGNAPRRRQLLQLWKGQERPLLEIGRCSGGKGFGLFAAEDIEAGRCMAEYCGEVITLQEMAAREKLYQQRGLFYIWQEQGVKSLPPDLFVESVAACERKVRASGSNKRRQEGVRLEGPLAIDATWVGGVARFINHSCSPNCKAVSVCNAKGTLRLDGHPLMLVAIEACRDISKGEEITFDYHPLEDEPSQGRSRASKQQNKADGQAVQKQKGHLPLGDENHEQQHSASQGRGRASKRQKDAHSQAAAKLTGKVKCECGAPNCRGVIFWE